MFDGGLNETLDLIALPHVGLDEDGLPSGFANQAGRLFSFR